MSETKTAPVESGAKRALREQTDQSLLDYLQGLQGETPIRVTVVRETPKTWKGRNIEGTLEAFDEPISETDIREMYGGGKYRLRVQTPNAKGSYIYAASRTIKIAGDPKLEHMATEAPTEATQPNVVRETLRLSERMIDKAHQRAEQVEARASQRPEADRGMELLVQTLQQQLGQVAKDAAAKDARIHDLVASQNQRGPTDVLFEKMLDGDNGRIAALRGQHDSEVRSIRERHLAEMDRLSARFDEQARRYQDQIREIREVHAREMHTLTTAGERELHTTNAANQAVNDGLKAQLAHQELELASAKSELSALRTKKDKSVIDSVSELAAVREALGVFGGEDASTLNQVLSAVMASPLVSRISDRLTAPATPPLLPPSPPVRVVPLRARRRVVRAQQPADKPTSAPSQQKEGPSQTEEPSTLSTGLTHMEQAFTSEVEPQTFAETARPLIGEAGCRDLAAGGANGLVLQISSASPSSPLVATQRGKDWTRAVTQCLIESAPKKEPG